MDKEKNHRGEIDLKDYKDTDGVSLKGMGFGLWLAQKRKLFFRLAVAFLVALCAFFFIYSGYHYVIYFLTGGNNLAEGEDMVTSPRQLVDELLVGEVSVLPSQDKYDLAVRLENPNEKFSASFSYCFVAGEADLSCGQSFILPGENKYILSLAQSPGAGQTVSLRLTGVAWSRFSARQAPDWETFKTQRLDIMVIEPLFSSGSRSGLSDQVSFNNLRFRLKNQGAYGYFQADFNILLYSGSQLLGVNRYSLSNFKGGEERPVSLSWPGSLSGVNRVEIVPDINILDEAVYLKYQVSD